MCIYIYIHISVIIYCILSNSYILVCMYVYYIYIYIHLVVPTKFPQVWKKIVHFSSTFSSRVLSCKVPELATPATKSLPIGSNGRVGCCQREQQDLRTCRGSFEVSKYDRNSKKGIPSPSSNGSYLKCFYETKKRWVWAQSGSSTEFQQLRWRPRVEQP